MEVINKLLLFLLAYILVGFSVAAQSQELQPVPTPTPFPPLLSPFLPSPELRSSFTILNTHAVSSKILRGMDPREKLSELAANGITDLLVFKPVDSPATNKEFIARMNAAGIPNVRIVDMPWKDIQYPYTACANTIKALRYMKEVEESPDRKMFAHCTVGEDRTGMLMGLYRMLNERWSKEKAFQDEMCRWGYERGNPVKPYKRVVCEVREGLTPLYLRLAHFINAKKLTWDSLDNPDIENKICNKVRSLKKDIGNFKCEISQEELDLSQNPVISPMESCEDVDNGGPSELEMKLWLYTRFGF